MSQNTNICAFRILKDFLTLKNPRLLDNNQIRNSIAFAIRNQLEDRATLIELLEIVRNNPNLLDHVVIQETVGALRSWLLFYNPDDLLAAELTVILGERAVRNSAEGLLSDVTYVGLSNAIEDLAALEGAALLLHPLLNLIDIHPDLLEKEIVIKSIGIAFTNTHSAAAFDRLQRFLTAQHPHLLNHPLIQHYVAASISSHKNEPAIVIAIARMVREQGALFENQDIRTAFYALRNIWLEEDEKNHFAAQINKLMAPK